MWQNENRSWNSIFKKRKIPFSDGVGKRKTKLEVRIPFSHVVGKRLALRYTHCFRTLYTRNFGAKTYFLTKSVYILHTYNQTTEYISKRAPQKVGGTLLFNREMRKIFIACSITNMSTERHPRLPNYSPPLFPLFQISLLPEPASTARDAHKAAQYVFPL